MTASLAALMEAPEPAPVAGSRRVEAVPEAIEIAADPSSGADVALCEVEIIEASGPIQWRADAAPPPCCRRCRHAARARHSRRRRPPSAAAAPRRSVGAALEPTRQLFERVFGGPSGTAPGAPGLAPHARAAAAR